MSDAIQLAIVIPAYRARFLAEALASLAAQTSRGFRVYVGDDGSPEGLAEIVAPFAGRLELHYHRFPENVGGGSLVRHWERAIALTHEPWIWLFSDDDLAGPRCVELFLEDLRVAPQSQGLRRLDLEFVGPDGGVLARELDFPTHLSGPAYARHLLATGSKTCVIQNIIFPRAGYEEAGRFTDSPGGFCSDCATWPRLARPGGVRRVRGGRVSFRRHPGATSDTLLRQLADYRPLIASYGDSLHEMRRALGDAPASPGSDWRLELAWYCRWFRYYPRRLNRAERAFVTAELARLWPQHPWTTRCLFLLNYTVSALRRSRYGGRLVRMGQRLAQPARGERGRGGADGGSDG